MGVRGSGLSGVLCLVRGPVDAGVRPGASRPVVVLARGPDLGRLGHDVKLVAFPPKMVTERDVMCLNYESLARLRIDPLTADEPSPAQYRQVLAALVG